MRARACRSRHRPPADDLVTIESLDQEGRGVAHVDGKAMFVEGALPGERVDVAIAQATSRATTIARVARDPQGQRVARRAALPALRRLRRLHAAARAPGAAGRGQAARARGRARAHRPRAPGASAAADRRPGVGLPVPRAAVGAPRREEGRRAGRLPRAQVELRRRHDRVPRAAARSSRACCRRCARSSARCRSATGCRRSRSPSASADGAHRRLRARAAHPRAADARGRGAARRVRRRDTASSSGCRRAAPRPSCRSIRRTRRSRTTLPEFAVDDAVRAHRVHAGQQRDQPRAGAARDGAARAAAGRARRRLLLRPRQLHAADRAAAAPTSLGVEGSAALVRRAEENARAQRPRRARALRRREPLRGDAREHRGVRPPRPRADRPAARGRGRARQVAARGATTKAASRGSSTCRARRARSRATPPCSCTSAATASPRRASSTCSRTRRTSSRSPCSTEAPGRIPVRPRRCAPLRPSRSRPAAIHAPLYVTSPAVPARAGAARSVGRPRRRRRSCGGGTTGVARDRCPYAMPDTEIPFARFPRRDPRGSSFVQHRSRNATGN